jgi:hypothetical protein
LGQGRVPLLPIPPKLVAANMLQIIDLSVPCRSRVAQRL